MNENAEDQVLGSFPLFLRPLIQQIYLEKIGLCSKTVEISNLTHSNKDASDANNYKDQFCLAIPYAGQKIYWDIYFHYSDYSFAPDFDFSYSNNFMSDPDLSTIEEFVPSWCKWDYKNEKSLVNVLREFISLYRKYQVDLLDCDKFTRLSTEYQLLTGGELIKPENVEVLVSGEIVHFLILLEIDISCLPEYAQPKNDGKVYNPCETTATLRVTFIKPDASKTKVDLYLSPKLEQLIGGNAKSHIPAFPKQSGLLDYVPDIARLLNGKLEILAKHYKLKCEYISTLVHLYLCNILEFDSIQFTKCFLNLEFDNTPYIVSVTLNSKFPDEKPKISLKSIYQVSDNVKLDIVVFDEYSYSPRWTPKEMIERAFSDIEKKKKSTEKL